MRGASLTLSPIVDLPDGSVELLPDARQARLLKLVAIGSVTLAVLTWLVFVGVTLSIPQISWPIRLLLLAFFGATEWVLWVALKPPVLRADAMEVSCAAKFDRQRMQRSDLAFIFRGQVTRKGQSRGRWNKSYIFAATDGKVGMSCSAVLFSPDGMARFAQRLQVPVRGDFTVQVKDRVPDAG